MVGARAKAKAKIGSSGVTLKCSPLKRRTFLSSAGLANTKKDFVGSMFSSGAKNSGVMRIVSQYTEMETEVMSLKRRYFESRQKVKMLKDIMKDQRAKSRKIIVSCALKLQEKEKEIEEISMQRQVDLTKIAQELVFLKSNMMKEQIRISASLKEKDIQIWKLEAELRKYKLDTKATSASNCCTCSPPSQSSAAYSPPSSTTCCSSEDSSPEQGCRVPRFQIRPPASLPPSVCLVPPSLPPPLYLGSRRRRSRLATTTTTTTPISSSNKSSQGVSGGGPDDAFICTPGSGLIKGDFEETSPPPSSRSSICSDIKDSGRDTEDSENIYEVIGGGPFEDDFRPPPPPPPPPRRKNNDPLPKFLWEGGPSHKSAIISPSVTSTNHKNFLKPSDIKNRQQQQHNHRAKDSSCLLSCSVSAADLSIQEEHELSIVGGRVTQTTYWTGKRFL